jgi:hypothetical protein
LKRKEHFHFLFFCAFWPKNTQETHKRKAATVHTLSTARPVVGLAEVEFKLNRNRADKMTIREVKMAFKNDWSHFKCPQVY